MRAPSPYRTIAVATTFSPRFKQVLAEAKRIRERFSADLHLIFAGKRTEETAKKFHDTLAQLQLPIDSKIHYEEGDPADAILRALAREKIDMVIAGALEKELVLHPFLGNVARRIVREAPCSVMLFTKPLLNPTPLSRIVFIADYGDHGLQGLIRILPLAAAESCASLLRLTKRVRRFVQIQGDTKGPDHMMMRKTRWKNLFYLQARPKCRLKPAASAAILG
jgi:nucleotide-binding universal stress UspA family protein